MPLNSGNRDEPWQDRHRSVLRRAHTWFEARALPVAATSPGAGFRFVSHRHSSAAARQPMAFLASFTLPATQYIIPLKAGLNRVGRSVVFGDFRGFPRRRPIVEGRQWLILCTPDLALIVDDHSTNQSVVLPHERRLAGSTDPRAWEQEYTYASLLEVARELELTVLDWAGDVTYALGEGDVLLGVYAGFVFGRVPPPTINPG